MTRRVGERVLRERELTVPIIRGREIKGFQYSPVRYFYLVPYVEGNLIDWQHLENAYPMTFRHLDRFRRLSISNGAEAWHAYYTPPTYRQGEVIVSCRIVSPRSFARMDLSDKTIHGSAFGIAIKESRIDLSLLLLYLNSGDFWRQLDATMPPMGVGRRAIRMSILKELLIPRQIALPTEQDVMEAGILEKGIVQSMRKRNSEAAKSVFAKLDSLLRGDFVKKSGQKPADTPLDQ